MTAVTPSREALLACPFCGYAAMTSGDPTDKHDPAINIHCSECDAEGGWFRGADCVDRATKHWNTRLAAKPADEGVREAFKPFSDFMAGSSFSQLPDEMKLTNGSSIARRQLTVGDFKTLRSAIWPSTTGEPKR